MVAAFFAGLFSTLLALAVLKNSLPIRRNHAGKPIPSSTGLCLLPIILATLFVADGGAWAGLYLLAAGVVGFVDDVWGDGGFRGFAGHFGALFRGRVTTGLLKAVVLGGGALWVGGYLYGVTFAGLVAALLMAGCANLGNLLDVKPGRAIKLTAAPALVGMIFALGWALLPPVAGVLGGMAGLFYFDLKGRIMLGDAGAALAGSALGAVVVSFGPGVVWVISFALVAALTLVAEFSSISRLIEEVGVLGWFDGLGRG